MTIDVLDFASHEPELAHAALNRAFGSERPMRFSGDAAGFACELRRIDAGELGADTVAHTMSAQVVWEPAGLVIVSTVMAGGLDELVVAGRATGAAPGQSVLVAGHGGRLTASWSHIAVRTLRIATTVVARVAGERTDARGRVDFADAHPISGGAGRRWGALCAFVHHELDAPDSALAEPLVQAAFTELVAAAALVTFENSAVTIDGTPRRSVAAPAAVRRAQAFIEARAQLPITVTEIAAASGVTPRALQHGFAHHLESSPTRYLRAVRLERAHHALREGTVDVTTVTEIAHRWGFAGPVGFARQYRDAVGELPGETLAR